MFLRPAIAMFRLQPAPLSRSGHGLPVQPLMPGRCGLVLPHASLPAAIEAA